LLISTFFPYTTLFRSAAENADMLVLCVKPQHLERALHEIRGRVDTTPLVLSIVAGIKIRMIAENLHNSRIVRSMPNTPGQIGQRSEEHTSELQSREKL